MRAIVRKGFLFVLCPKLQAKTTYSLVKTLNSSQTLIPSLKQINVHY